MRRLVRTAVLVPLVLAGCSTGGAAPRRSSAAPATSAASSAALPAHTPPTTHPARSPTRSAARTTPPPSRPATSPPQAVPTAQGVPPAVRGAPLVVLNPGHNGGNASHPAEIARLVPADRYGDRKACDTTGTNTDAGYAEHAFTWDVSLRVRAILVAHGVRVALTRPNDTGVGPCVDERARIGNQAGSVAVVSIHADGAPTGDFGFHVCYDSRPPAGAAVDARSRALSRFVHDALSRSSGLVPAAYIGDGQGYYPRSDLAGLNLATVPATFLELGNMRNAHDAALLSAAAGRQQIAAAVAAGILAYLR